MNVLYRIQKKAAPFTHLTKYCDWKNVGQRRILTRFCAHFKAYSGERAWRAIGDRLSWPLYLNGVGLCRRIRDRKQGTDIEKYSFLNRAFKKCNQLPAEELEAYRCKTRFLER